jgi:hypothetical protein
VNFQVADGRWSASFSYPSPKEAVFESQSAKCCHRTIPVNGTEVPGRRVNWGDKEGMSSISIVYGDLGTIEKITKNLNWLPDIIVSSLQK